MGSCRLFVGLRLEAGRAGEVLATLRAALGLREDGPLPAGLRLYAAADLHVTLEFLGAVAEQVELGLASALREALAGSRSPELEIGAAGAFPARGHERVLWLGLRPAGALDELQARVHEVCAGQGLRLDPRPFRAHLTVGRVRGGRGPGYRVPEAFHALDPRVSWKPRSVDLVESLAGRTRPVGEPLYRSRVAFPLGPQGSGDPGDVP